MGRRSAKAKDMNREDRWLAECPAQFRTHIRPPAATDEDDSEARSPRHPSARSRHRVPRGTRPGGGSGAGTRSRDPAAGETGAPERHHGRAGGGGGARDDRPRRGPAHARGGARAHRDAAVSPPRLIQSRDKSLTRGTRRTQRELLRAFRDLEFSV